MTDDITEQYLPLLAKLLKHERFMHSLGVRDTAGLLAERYGADMQKARLAGLLHDITKNRNKEFHLHTLKKHGLDADKLLLHSRKVWHSVTGAYYVRDVLGIDDAEIFDAIRYHTTGRAGMTTLDKIIYTADFIEPSRKYEGAEQLRKTAFEDIDKACLEGVKFCIEEQLSVPDTIYPDTLDFYNDLIYKKGDV